MYLKTVGYNSVTTLANKPSGLISSGTLQYIGGPPLPMNNPDHVHAVVDTTTTRTTSIAPASTVNATSDTLSANALANSASNQIASAQRALIS